MNMAEYCSQRSKQPANVNFEPMLDSIAKEKKWGKNFHIFWEPFPLKHRVFLRKFSKSSHFGNVKGPVRHAL